MSNAPKDKSKTNNSAQNTSEPNSRAEPTASSETVHDKFLKMAAKNPRFREVKNLGMGFMIVGAKPK